MAAEGDPSGIASVPTTPPPEPATVRPTRAWPATRGHQVLHPVPGAVPTSAGATCPECLTLLWDPNNEAGGPHSVEVCEWNQASLERRDINGGRGWRFDWRTEGF